MNRACACEGWGQDAGSGCVCVLKSNSILEISKGCINHLNNYISWMDELFFSCLFEDENEEEEEKIEQKFWID